MPKRTREQQRQMDAANRFFDSFEGKTRGQYNNIPEKEGYTETIHEARKEFDEVIKEIEKGKPGGIKWVKGKPKGD